MEQVRRVDAITRILYTGDMLADGKDRTWNLDFSELYRVCHKDYPVDISSNLDVLYRLVLQHRSIAKQAKGLTWLREIVAARYFCEYRYIRNKLENKLYGTARPNPESSEGSVLVPFVPCRSDYQALIYPVTNILTEQGVNTFILFPKKGFLEEVDAQLFSGSHFLFSDEFITFRAYRRAKKHYSKLVPWLNKLCSQLRLNPQQCRHMHIFFQKYSLEKEIFRTVLTMIRPSVVYGLHYILNPGYLAAIDEMRGDGYRPIKLLIQHGAFVSGEFHEFKGADCAIVWGDYFKTVLNSKYLIPVPQCRVIGNPKLEVEVRKRKEGNGSNGRLDTPKSRNAVLFASTPDLPGEDYNRKALYLFTTSLRACCGEWSVLYKPHPGEDLAVYRSLVQNGFIGQEQIVGGGVSTYELIARADVVVGTKSTVIVEAAALGKPVIQVLPDMSGTDWSAYGLLGVSTEEELCSALNGILCSDEYRERVLVAQQTLVEKMFGTIVGASQNIADYIMTLL